MNFSAFLFTGADADKFLQGQITANVNKINDEFLPTAICNLKGRILFGLWIKKQDDGYVIVLSQDLADDFKAHIKKYGAFSKIKLSEPSEIYPCIIGNSPNFSFEKLDENWREWENLSLKTGNYWIIKSTSEQFQPQELRLHQRGGVDYDKGCYLGQEIIARLWFKAAPKAWLHLVQVADFSDKIQVVNQNDNFALVVARPDDVANLTVLDLPNPLNESVARS